MHPEVLHTFNEHFASSHLHQFCLQDAPGRLSWSNGYDDFTYTQQWADGQPNIV